MKRFIFIFSLVLRLGSLGCFLYAGVLSAKEYGPGVFKMIREKINSEATDPLALARKEAEIKEQTSANRKSSTIGNRKSEIENRNDDPYKYVGGGKKAEENEPLTQPSPTRGEGKGDGDEMAGKAGGQSLWDTKNLNSKFGGIDGAAKGEGGDLEALQNMATGLAAGGTSGKNQTKLASAAGISSVGGAAGGGAGGKTARSSRAGIQVKGSVHGRNAGALESARGAVGRGARDFRSGNFQTSSGGGNAAFGEGKTQNVLAMPGGPAGITGNLSGGDMNNPMPNIATTGQIHPPDRSHETPVVPTHRGLEIALAVLGLAASVGGIVLSANIAVRDTPLAYVWWIGFAAMAAAVVAIWAIVGVLFNMGDDGMAKALATAYTAVAVQLTIGLGLLAANVVMNLAQALNIGAAMTSVMSFLKSFIGGGSPPAPPPPPAWQGGGG